MSFLGTWNVDDVLTFPVNTSTPSTWAAVDADANPAWRLYKNETGTALLTGTMAKLDDANTTGFYTEQITLSAANGFGDGDCYTIYIAAVVGGVTITTVHTFQVEANLVGSISDLNDVVIAVQTTVDTIDATTQSIDGGIDTILDDRLPAALVGGRMDSSVGAMAANVLTAAALATDAVTEIQSGLATAASIAALNNLSAAQVNTEVDTALADVGVTTTVTGRIDATISSRSSHTAADVRIEMDANSTKLANLDATISSRATPAQVNAEVDTALADYDAPTFTELDARTDAIDAALVVIDDFLDTEIAAIKTKTDNLPADTAAVLTAIDDFLDTEIAAIKAKTDNLPTDPADDSDIDAQLATIAGYLDTEVAAIKAKTDLIPAAPAAVSDIPNTAQIVTAIRTYVLESGKTIEAAWLDIWAVVVGDAIADDATNPTLITYDSPDSSVQRTHALTSTTRVQT